MRSQWRLSTEAKYAWFVRRLGLSPETIDRLYDLLVTQMFETLDGPVQSVRSENGVPVLTPEYQALKTKQEREVAEIIGASGLAQLLEYDASYAYRIEVIRLQIDFVAGTPVLRENQIASMMKIFRDAKDAYEQASPSAKEYSEATPEKREQFEAKGLELRRQRDTRILRESAAVLTPAQHASLEARIRREQAEEELLRLAQQFVRVGKSTFARDPRNPGYQLLVGANDDLMLPDPEYRRAWLRLERLQAESTNADVPGLLELTPGIADQFFSLLVNQRLRRQEHPTRTPQAADETLRREEREMATLLGERGYTRFRKFQETYVYRYKVKWLQADIGAGPDALRPNQVEALISVLYDADVDMRRAAPSLVDGMFTTRRQREKQAARMLELRLQRDKTVHQSAAAFLGPSQLAALDSWLQRSVD